MSIQNYLNQIKNAIFGKDIRQAIYDAIKQCYDDASINNDNANMEVKLARGIYQTLKDRLNNNEENIKNNSSKIEEKADKATTQSIQQQINNLVLGAVGNGNNAEVVQARGSYPILNDRFVATEKYLKNLKSLALVSNEYTSYGVSSTEGSKSSESIAKNVDGFIDIDVRYNTESGSRIVEFHSGYKVKDIEEVIITVKPSVKEAYVAIGLGFNWGIMLKENVGKDYESVVRFKPSEIPTATQDSIFTISFGTILGSQTIGKFKYEVRFKNDYKTLSNISEKSYFSDESTIAYNAGIVRLTEKSLTRSDTGFTKVNGSNGEIILENNLTNPKNYFWGGYHLEIVYNDINDLDSIFNLNYKTISGISCNKFYLLKGVTDWNGANNPIELSLNSLNSNINLYETIVKAGQLETFKSLKKLYILVAVQPTSGQVNDSPFVWNIRPILERKSSVILATDMSTGLTKKTENLMIDTITNNIYKIPVGIRFVSKDNCIVRADNKKQYVLTSLPQGWINIKKESTEIGTNYAGIYARINYSKIDELDGDFIFEYKSNNDFLFDHFMILYDITDWGTGSVGYINITPNKKYNLKDLLKNASNVDYTNKNHLYVVGLKYRASGVSEVVDSNVRISFVSKTETLVVANELETSYKEKLIKEVNDYINNISKYISCWGDSLTAGGGWTTILSSLSGMPVYNMGVGGESSYTIYTRQGANAFMVDNLIIPASGSVSLGKNFKTMINYNDAQRPFRQGFANFNPCTIDGIEGTISYTGQWDSADDEYIFTRTTSGEQKIINRPTAIIGKCDKEYNKPYLMIIFIGQNGGWSNLDDLVNQHRRMIEHAKANNVIILGLSSGSKSDRAEYEARMKKEFGRYFISLREYLSVYGLLDAGIEPTETDKQMMLEGKTPQSLLSDTVHYNTQCKTVIGKLIYKRCCELNIF